MSLFNTPFDSTREAALVIGAGHGIGRAIACWMKCELERNAHLHQRNGNGGRTTGWPSSVMACGGGAGCDSCCGAGAAYDGGGKVEATAGADGW